MELPLDLKIEDNWKMKVTEQVNKKVVFEWTVNVCEEHVLVRSPIFWHPESIKWCLEFSTDAMATELWVNLFSSLKDPSLKALVKVSVHWDGLEIPESKIITVTLEEVSQKIHLISWGRPLVDQIRICGDVSIPIEVSVQLKCAAKHTDLCTLSNGLGALLDSGDFSDFVLQAGGKEFRVHKALLVARSPVFAAMLRHDTYEAQTDTVNIEDVEPNVLREVLRYIYTGSVPLMGEMAHQLLAAADKYSLTGLKELCENELANTLSVDNVAATGIVALKHSCHLLQRSVVIFIKKNPTRVLSSEGWATAIRQHPEDAINLSRLIGEDTWIY